MIQNKKRHQPFRLYPFILVLVFATSGFMSCDPAFNPVSDDDEYIFAIQGYLDASADTQWVRVMPIRKSVDLKRDAPATVVLEHPESGQSAVMKDSLFEFVYTHAVNYWSTMNIKAGETYRLTAERSDGATSSATVTLPEDFPTPVVQMGRSGFDYVYINGIKKLADVHTRFHTESGEIVVVPHIRDTVSRRSDDYVVAIDPAEDLAALGEHNTDGYTRKEIFVAAGGPNWPPMGSIDEDLISMPEGVSNVTSGAGYLAGIVSKILPYRSCFDENGDHAPCPLE